MGTIPDWLNRDPESIWKCPCGFTDRYKAVQGHRKGWKKRPECAGKIEQVSDALPVSAGEDSSDVLFDNPSPAIQVTPDQAEHLSAEELARQFNEQAAHILPGHRNEQAFGFGLPIETLDGDPGDSEWELEPPAVTSEVSEVREGVHLPVQVRIMYDWFRGEGWTMGDDSLSAWVWDMLSTHWGQCMGMRIGVFRGTEVRLGESEAVGISIGHSEQGRNGHQAG